MVLVLVLVLVLVSYGLDLGVVDSMVISGGGAGDGPTYSSWIIILNAATSE